jgi:hypothetical protein
MKGYFMKKIFVLLSLVLMLTACGEESKIKDVIRNNLKDPESAMFKDAVFSSDGKSACIVWNAKNSMGGYGDWKTSFFDKINSEWSGQDEASLVSECSELYFKSRDAYNKALVEAGIKAIEILQKAKNISSSEAMELSKKSCHLEVENFSREAAYIAQFVFFPTNRWNDGSFEKAFQSNKSKLEKGQCDESVNVPAP